ncbi:hypothetical protein BGW42_002083 [Actinomortierella wolfii]|nr:hypothetical protein BGW42_002083 [Actinomortierella wolfii]
MPPSEMSFKEKYLKLREKFDAVSGVHRQYTSELEAAQDKIKRLKDENNHLLDLLSDLMKKDGVEPMSESETSSDNDEDDEKYMNHNVDEEAGAPQRNENKDGQHRSMQQPSTLNQQSEAINGH